MALTYPCMLASRGNMRYSIQLYILYRLIATINIIGFIHKNQIDCLISISVCRIKTIDNPHTLIRIMKSLTNVHFNPQKSS